MCLQLGEALIYWSSLPFPCHLPPSWRHVNARLGAQINWLGLVRLQQRLDRRACAHAGMTEDRGVGAGAEVTEAGCKPDVSLHGGRWHASSPGTIEGFTRTSATCGRTPAWC